MMKQIANTAQTALGLFLWTLYYSIPVLGILVFCYGLYDTYFR